MINPLESTQTITGHGKFFVRAGKKFFFKAARPEVGAPALDFEQKLRLRARLEELKQARTTGLVVRSDAAESAFDLAAQLGLSVMVEIEVAPAELLDARGYLTVAARVARTVSLFRGHPAVVGYLFDVPVAADWLKMHGLSRFQRRLRRLLAIVRRNDASRLASVRHRPATRALALPEEDLIYSSVPPLTVAELRSYVLSLHDIAEARPVVLEFSQPQPHQDELVGCAFALGVAGVVASPVTYDAPVNALGLRSLSAGELLPFLTLNGSCPPALREPPMVSVVICAYNAERTMRACLESLAALDYPDYEVIVVDDGSRDRTAEIAMDFPAVRLIRQPNKGLSVARNVGLYAARGEVVAYTDSDCVVDPHWLTLMVGAMVDNGFEACGGPNYAPHEDSPIAACVAAAPGAPCHVLTADDRAEHLAGCNMAFRKALLVRLGGFDAQFTSAGDDVDICWRAQAAGVALGFCPAAFVWHFRRNTVRAYWGQQRGYGRAEAMLSFKHAERFNALGQVKWQGKIPGLARTLPGGTRKRVFWGGGTRAFFQTVYEPEQSLLKFLPQTLEWNLLWAALATVAYVAGLPVLPALVMLGLGPVWAFHYAVRAPLERCHRCWRARLMVTMLAYSGPMVRAVARYRLRFRGAWSARSAAGPALRQRPRLDCSSAPSGSPTGTKPGSRAKACSTNSLAGSAATAIG